ncbi:hypothetical protein LOD99_3153 [Oopsacas minuta]|uniref:THAP-type domain-containing protein n=1 Tax=Oopsacas minuta TaxID=111878 RepID=A0AAV7JYH8_9METZ|nr:hypothetical protein LOD99_3153 [Oopsacas minuta]
MATRALHREDIEDLKNVFVCSNHFRTEDVITEMDILNLMAHYKKILGDQFYIRTLYLVFFPVVPTLEQSLDFHKAEDSKFGVKSLGELKCKPEEFELPSSWVKWFSDDTSINLLKLSKDKHIYIPAYVSINDSLTPTDFNQNIQIPLTIHNLSDIREIDTIIKSSDDNIVDLDPYNRVFNEEETPIILDASLIQSLAFIAGYCVHSIFKSAFYSKRGITHSSGVRDTEEVSSICSQCLSSLVKEDTLELDITDPIYGLICSIDRRP